MKQPSSLTDNMPAVIAALPTIFELIRLAVPGVQNLIQWVLAVRTTLQQNAAWTPELEEAFIASLVATKTDPAYQPDPVA